MDNAGSSPYELISAARQRQRSVVGQDRWASLQAGASGRMTSAPTKPADNHADRQDRSDRLEYPDRTDRPDSTLAAAPIPRPAQPKPPDAYQQPARYMEETNEPPYPAYPQRQPPPPNPYQNTGYQDQYPPDPYEPYHQMPPQTLAGQMGQRYRTPRAGSLGYEQGLPLYPQPPTQHLGFPDMAAPLPPGQPQRVGWNLRDPRGDHAYDPYPRIAPAPPPTGPSKHKNLDAIHKRHEEALKTAVFQTAKKIIVKGSPDDP